MATVGLSYVVFTVQVSWNEDILASNVTSLCHSPVYHRAMLCAVYAAMRCPSLCPSSVCLSVTFVSFVKTNKHIFKIFSPWGSQAILVFHTKRSGAIPTGTPLTGASNARGYEKNDDFRPISRSVSETVIVRWAHAARQFVSIEFSFHPYNI